MPYRVLVKEEILEGDKYYKNHLILHYSIKYPRFISDEFRPFFSKLNEFYCTKATGYERNNVAKLYQMAMVDFENSVANGFPIHQYEAIIDFTVTYNKNCALSLYFDQYEYTGGAHGNTIRFSDTWNIKKSCHIRLCDLVGGIENYREFIINSINKTIAHEISQGNSLFFENYSELVNENFKENNFYLTPDGIVIYFQQYAIGPYVSGIQTFTIPFSLSGVKEPRC